MIPFGSKRVTLWLAVGLVAGLMVWWALPAVMRRYEDPRSQARLSRIAAELNRSVPVMIDAETELMPLQSAPGLLIYSYRLVNYSLAQIDPAKFAAGARERVKQGACTTAETRADFLDKGVTLRYAYYDKEKRHIATVDVTPSDCQR